MKLSTWELATEMSNLVNKANLVHNFSLVCLFLFSICFGQLCVHHQEKQLYVCDTGTCYSVLTTVWYTSNVVDRGSTVAKVLCYKSDGRWFDPSWCQWIFH